ncbi:hypothetical protein AGDE_11940 [Angomonas deanei]|uniref:Guanine nucleotide-binding protein subunit beta-like protein n=1 Tax=Angomonas deanei TaxID=59799 RepID=A0A7G2CB54_9TRYP|nr:hypothetical protein AGDE_11940 [Angomonas deanei]CAD2215973.1 hypothetical protein, conserved [Angomonas deanei]|eukprot:EPY25260.1 hypothetical protein AGDE_11940 [Angomonas deanei]
MSQTTENLSRLYLRHLYPSPDNPNEVLCSTNTGAVLPADIKDGGLVLKEDCERTPWVRLPSPAVDLAWCPFRKGEDDASFLTTSANQPLQMWDMEDGLLRASYTAYNDAGLHAQPSRVLWRSGESASVVVAGYGGFEDTKHIRFFDVLVEGDSATGYYSSPCSRGLVVALGEGPKGVGRELYAASFRGGTAVEVVDKRRHCPAVLLHGLTSYADSLQLHPEEPYCLYAGSAQADGRILCWDIRRPADPLRAFTRQVKTYQRHNFSFLVGKNHPYTLVSAGGEDGVLFFDFSDESAGDIACHKKVPVDSYVSCIAPLSGGARVLALTGRRAFTLGEHVERAGECEEPENMPAKRVRPPMSSSDEDEPCAPSPNRYTSSFDLAHPNATVVSV